METTLSRMQIPKKLSAFRIRYIPICHYIRAFYRQLPHACDRIRILQPDPDIFQRKPAGSGQNLIFPIRRHYRYSLTFRQSIHRNDFCVRKQFFQFTNQGYRKNFPGKRNVSQRKLSSPPKHSGANHKVCRGRQHRKSRDFPTSNQIRQMLQSRICFQVQKCFI